MNPPDGSNVHLIEKNKRKIDQVPDFNNSKERPHVNMSRHGYGIYFDKNKEYDDYVYDYDKETTKGVTWNQVFTRTGYSLLCLARFAFVFILIAWVNQNPSADSLNPYDISESNAQTCAIFLLATTGAEVLLALVVFCYIVVGHRKDPYSRSPYVKVFAFRVGLFVVLHLYAGVILWRAYNEARHRNVLYEIGSLIVVIVSALDVAFFPWMIYSFLSNHMSGSESIERINVSV
jgi:hypothetical protein